MTLPEEMYPEEDSGRDSRRILIGVIIVLCLIITGEAVYNFVILPWINISRIEFESELPLDEKQVLAAAGLDNYTDYYSLDVEAVRSRLIHFPGVLKVEVEKIFPDTLRIRLFARRPTALALYQDGERTSALAVDVSGMIFQENRDIRQWNLPVISGIRFEGTSFIGESLPEDLIPLLASLEDLRENSPLLFDQISEIRVDRRSSGGYDCRLYLAGRRIPVKTEPELSVGLLKNILVVLDVVEKSGNPEEGLSLDFRTSEIVYSYGEE